ncbi:MAG: NAD(P)H-hydrate dehydratase [Gammaproteobacteria bacterium]|nr:NAD(P)H-hydrate dehydratase [Gammaproteobacteria bacterium]
MEHRKLDYDSIKHQLSKRDSNTHKGNYGHVLVIGGDKGFGGAALMAGMSAARTGAGLVSVATHPDHCAAFLARCPELMVKGVEDSADLVSLMPSATVVVLGPGLGQSDWSQVCLKLAIGNLTSNKIPLVLDADALNLLSQGSGRDDLDKLDEIVLTPHPGEAARLLGCTTEEVQADRASAVARLQEIFGGVVILKGAGTLICYSQGERQQIDQCRHGNPGMASGGMGDVLSGVLGGLLAQGFSLSESCRLGVCIHSHAADLQAKAKGERGLLATDLLDSIRALVNP